MSLLNFFPQVSWELTQKPLTEVKAETLNKTELDLYLAELELERAVANRDMYAKRLERLK